LNGLAQNETESPSQANPRPMLKREDADGRVCCKAANKIQTQITRMKSTGYKKKN
jgi:hypothetical protein